MVCGYCTTILVIKATGIKAQPQMCTIYNLHRLLERCIMSTSSSTTSTMKMRLNTLSTRTRTAPTKICVRMAVGYSTTLGAHGDRVGVQRSPAVSRSRACRFLEGLASAPPYFLIVFSKTMAYFLNVTLSYCPQLTVGTKYYSYQFLACRKYI